MAPSQIRWTDEMETILSDVLLLEVQTRGLRAQNGLKTDTYKALTEAVNTVSVHPVTPIHVKNHIKHQRKKFCIAREAVMASGFGICWDAENKYITADPESWAEYCKGRDSSVKNLLHKSFILYEALYAIYGDDNAAGDESVGVNEPIQDNASINLDEDGEEAGEATPQPHVSDNSTRQPSSTATKRRKTRASSSQGPSDEVYVRIAGALEDLSSSFKDKIHRNTAFEGAIDELTELGLDEVHLNTAVTLLAGNKGYAKAFMLTRRERRVGYVIGLLTAHGFL